MKHSIIACIFLSVIFPCCDKGEKQEEPEVVVADNTKILDDESAAVLGSTSEDYSVIEFNGSTLLLESLVVNDVLVSSVYAGIPYGFLRRITGIYRDGNQFIISTEQATLNDAFEKARVRLIKSYDPNEFFPESYNGGIGVSVFAEEEGIYYEIEDMVLLDMDGDTDTTGDQVVVSGSISVTPSIILEIDIGWLTLDRVEFGFEVSANANLQLTAFAFSASLEEREQIGSPISLSPIVFFVGVVPVVITPVITAYVGLDGEVSIGIESSLNIDEEYGASIVWEDGAWGPPIPLHTSNMVFEPPRLRASCTAKTYAEAQLSFLIYGIVGPYISMEPIYFELDADIDSRPQWQLFGGFHVGAGFKVDMLGYEEIASYDIADLIDFRQLLAEGDILLDCPADMDCTARECGPDPVCGESCGTCDAGWTCTEDGICEGGCEPLHNYEACNEGDVFWFDGCNVPVEVSVACLPDEICLEAACVSCGGASEPCCTDDSCDSGLTCTPAGCMSDCSPAHDHLDCYDDDVYWFDACGYQNDLSVACGTGETCVSGACAACGAASQPCCDGSACNTGLFCNSGVCQADCSPSHDHQGCYNDDVYWFDGCNSPTDLVTNCTSSQTCRSSSCVPCGGNGQVCCYDDSCDTGYTCSGGTCLMGCEPFHSYLDCSGDDVYWFDACGASNDLYMDCAGSTPVCYSGSCVECLISSDCGAGRSCSSHRCSCSTPTGSSSLSITSCAGGNVSLSSAGSAFTAYGVNYYLMRHCTLTPPPCSTSTLVQSSASPNFSTSDSATACPSVAFYVVYICNRESGCASTPPGSCTTCSAISNIVANPGDCP